MNMRRPYNRDLQSLLVEAEWTQAALARSVNLLGKEVGLDLRYDRTSVAHWLVGVRPRQQATALLAEAFTRRLRRPITPSMLGLAADPDDSENRTRDEGSAIESLSELSTTELNAGRAKVMAQEPYHLPQFTPLGVPRLADGGARQDKSGAEQRVGMAHVLALRASVDAFAVVVDSIGGNHGRSSLAALLADAASTWLRAPSPGAVHAELLTSAARLTLLLARMHVDAQAQGLAQRYLRTSLRLAREADDRSTSAIALRVMSAQAHGLGHYREALDLARSAARTASAAPAHVRAFTLAQLAVAQAADKDRAHALASLRAAERLAGAADSAPGPFGSYAPGALAYQQAETLGQLGDHRAAIAALRTSLSQRATSEVRSRALTQAQLAERHLRLGHLDAACDAWQLFLDDYPQLGSGKADHSVRTLRQQLAPHRLHAPARATLTRAYALTHHGLERV
ncbi:tetratricopeptide repeat protein [Streptomyces sp. NPDC055709]